MISINRLSIHFGSFELFKEVSFAINPRDRIGLVGKNGAGKSTLLKVLLGKQAPTSGSVVIPSGLTTGYLPQEMVHADNCTVFEEAAKGFEDVKKLDDKIKKINEELESRTDYQSEGYYNLIHDLTEATDRYEMLDGGSIDSVIEKTLVGLGFTWDELHRPTNQFSGGWRMRVELAKVLLRKPDILLLDEPTNHLDIESIQWLEDFLAGYPGALVLISHDRAFLDNVTNRTIEISLGKVFDYNVPYTKYVELSQDRRDIQKAAYINQQKMIDDTERFIERFRYKATKAVQVQSRIKQLDKIDRIEVEEEDKASMAIKFPPAPRSGTIVIEADKLVKKYDTKLVLDKIGLIIERGEKVALVGKNGEGKTTLSKIIVGDTDFSGTLKIGHNVKIGYFAQNQDELLNKEKTVLQTIDDIAVGEIRTKVRDILGAFLFSGEDVDKKVRVLSGGEKSRLALAKLLLEPYNLLVLDEPTNHLDMRSKDLLKQALATYDGTLIIVSHDRQFLDGLITKLYEFKNHQVKEFRGGIYEFLERKKISSLQQLEVKAKIDKTDKKVTATVGKEDYINKKEFDKKLRKAAGLVSKSEKKIESIETELSSISELLNHSKNIENGMTIEELSQKYESLKNEMDKEMGNWSKLHEDYEKLNESR